jgi:STE24 endopeptidase
MHSPDFANARPAHPTKLLLIAQSHLLFTLTVFSLFIHNKSLFASFGFDPRLATTSPQPILIGFMLFQLVLDPLDTVLKFGLNALTRRYEYQAGMSAAVLPGYELTGSRRVCGQAG